MDIGKGNKFSKQLQFCRDIFDDRKENLASYFKEHKPVLWTFHPKIVFDRLQAFLNRLETIQSFFNTVLEFMKLEKVEIGGLKGRSLSSKIQKVSTEFKEHLLLFGSKSYDVLNPEDRQFEADYGGFQARIQELDRRLAQVLCEAFDDCCNLESIFKLIDIVGSVLDRPIIKQEFTSKYDAIVIVLGNELTTARELYEEQMKHFHDRGYMVVATYMPPVAGTLYWTEQIRQRASVPVASFKVLQHPIVSSQEAQIVLEQYTELMELLAKLDEQVFADWAAVVSEQCERNLKLSLLKRNKKNKQLELNFHPQLAAILREVHYLKQMERDDIPQEGLDLYERVDTFRKYTNNLNQTIEWYNKVCRSSKSVEFELVKEHVEEIDKLVEQGQTGLSWNSPELWEFIEQIHRLVHNLEMKVQKTQENLEEIKNIMSAWSRVAVFQRKDSKKDTLLNLDERYDQKEKRYGEISTAADQIHHLLEENMHLFGMENNQDSPAWLNYIDFVDNIVNESLLKTVGCRCYSAPPLTVQEHAELALHRHGRIDKSHYHSYSHKYNI